MIAIYFTVRPEEANKLIKKLKNMKKNNKPMKMKKTKELERYKELKKYVKSLSKKSYEKSY